VIDEMKHDPVPLVFTLLLAGLVLALLSGAVYLLLEG
jgi:hypothetical protein